MSKLHILAIEIIVLYLVAVHYMSRLAVVGAAIEDAMTIVGK